jgi:hypothetical protein
MYTLKSLDQVREEAEALTVDDIAAREREVGVFGPFTRLKWARQAPPHVRRNIERSGVWPYSHIKMTRQGFEGMDVNDVSPVAHTAVTASATETNLWDPAIWTPIPANDMRGGKAYRLTFGGIFTSTATQGLLTFTPRVGQSGTPASNITLGASNVTAPAASLTNAAWYGQFILVIRSIGLAAGGATGTGTGFVITQGAAAATGITYVMGGSIPTTLQSTAASGLIVSLTISVASQSYQAAYAILQSLN